MTNNLNMKTAKQTKRLTKSSKTTPNEHRYDLLFRNDMSFPFLSLPGEVRNMIYEYALVDSKYAMRFEATMSKRGSHYIVKQTHRARPGPPDREDLANVSKGSLAKSHPQYRHDMSFPQHEFRVQLMQVCRQINEEAAPLFYGGNLFVFGGVPHLYAFLTHFAIRLPLVQNIGLVSGYTGYYDGLKMLKKMELHSIFPLLASATSLSAIYINPPVLQSLSSGPRTAAERFAQQGHTWLTAMKFRKQDPLDVINITAVAYGPTKRSNPLWTGGKDVPGSFLHFFAAKLRS